MLVPEEGSSSAHQGLDLELDSIVKWESWVCLGVLLNGPSLVDSVVALVPDDVSHVGVGSTVDIEALVDIVSDVSSVSWVESGLLVGLVSEVSNNSVHSVSESVSLSSRDSHSSISRWSDGSGSAVEDPPLSVVP